MQPTFKRSNEGCQKVCGCAASPCGAFVDAARPRWIRNAPHLHSSPRQHRAENIPEKQLSRSVATRRGGRCTGCLRSNRTMKRRPCTQTKPRHEGLQQRARSASYRPMMQRTCSGMNARLRVCSNEGQCWRSQPKTQRTAARGLRCGTHDRGAAARRDGGALLCKSSRNFSLRTCGGW